MLGGLLAGGHAQEVFNYLKAGQPPALEIMSLGMGLYLARGDWGANVGFIVGDDGVLVIDAKATEQATKRVIREIAKITERPIAKVIITHSDSDCVNGYQAYPKNADLIMSQKAWEEMASGLATYLEMNAPSEIYVFKPEFRRKPTLTFDGRLRIWFGQETIEILHYGQAHTSGDAIVIFPDRKVAFVGDLVFGDRDPLIQDRKGGYSFGLVRVLSILLNEMPAIQEFVPSHSAPLRRDRIQSYLRSIEAVQSRVIDFVGQGKSLEDVIRAFGVQDAPQRLGNWVWPSFPVIIYRELSQNRDLAHAMMLKNIAAKIAPLLLNAIRY